MFNLPRNSPFLITLIVFIAIELLLSFPVVFFPIANIAIVTYPPLQHRFLLRLLVHVCVVYFMILLAALVPKISLGVTLAGAFANR
jgi:hypothetical protein